MTQQTRSVPVDVIKALYEHMQGVERLCMCLHAGGASGSQLEAALLEISLTLMLTEVRVLMRYMQESLLSEMIAPLAPPQPEASNENPTRLVPRMP